MFFTNNDDLLTRQLNNVRHIQLFSATYSKLEVCVKLFDQRKWRKLLITVRERELADTIDLGGKIKNIKFVIEKNIKSNRKNLGS